MGGWGPRCGPTGVPVTTLRVHFDGFLVDFTRFSVDFTRFSVNFGPFPSDFGPFPSDFGTVRSGFGPVVPQWVTSGATVGVTSGATVVTTVVSSVVSRQNGHFDPEKSGCFAILSKLRISMFLLIPCLIPCLFSSLSLIMQCFGTGFDHEINDKTDSFNAGNSGYFFGIVKTVNFHKNTEIHEKWSL